MKSLNNSACPPLPLSMPRDPSIARATKTPQAAGPHSHEIPVSHGQRRHPRRQVDIGHARGFGRLQEEEGDGGRVAAAGLVQLLSTPYLNFSAAPLLDPMSTEHPISKIRSRVI